MPTLNGYDLSPGSDLRGALLSGAELDGLDLTGCNFSEAILTGATLVDAILTDTLFRGAILTDAVLFTQSCAGADFTGAHMRNAVLPYLALAASASNIIAKGAKIPGATVQGELPSGDVVDLRNLRGLVAEAAMLVQSNFNAVDATGATFKGGRLNRSGFRGSILRECDFRGCELQQVDFAGSDLTDARFERATIRGAIFRGARMTGTILEGVGVGAPFV